MSDVQAARIRRDFQFATNYRNAGKRVRDDITQRRRQIVRREENQSVLRRRGRGNGFREGEKEKGRPEKKSSGGFVTARLGS